VYCNPIRALPRRVSNDNAVLAASRALWERRLSEARLSLVSGVSMKELAALEEERELVGV